jgi:hypothetical protein
MRSSRTLGVSNTGVKCGGLCLPLVSERRRRIREYGQPGSQGLTVLAVAHALHVGQ